MIILMNQQKKYRTAIKKVATYMLKNIIRTGELPSELKKRSIYSIMRLNSQ